MARKFGALPPPDVAWQTGKTAASIRFVNDAEQYITNCNNASDIEKLEEAIQEVKKGGLVLYQWLTPEEFLTEGEVHLS